MAIVGKPLKLNIMFHMHQPWYKDAHTNKYLMPFVQLHGVKDYLGMARLSQKFPKVKVTFNYVPSLVEQIKDYTDHSPEDHYRTIAMKDPKELTHEEKAFILKNFVVRNRLAEESLRYMELTTNIDAGRPISDCDFQDLQVLFYLIWFPKSVIDNDRDIDRLYHKGKDFSDADKKCLFSRLDHCMKQILPEVKKLQDDGIVELTASPYYHPILPLLHNSEFARVNMPRNPLPRSKFRHPEDARHQIDAAVHYHNRIFGKAPQGMWPSEGSISNQVIKPIDEAGIKWIASGQKNLVNSLYFSRGRNADWPVSASELCAPWKAVSGDHSSFIVFRDDGLSDLIGFKYNKYACATDAVNNLFWNIHNIKAELEKNPGSLGDRPGLLSLILDGENAWEYYPGNGRYFLEELYGRLSNNDEGIETTTVTDYLKDYGCPDENVLSRLSPGSWIGGDFATWIGSPGANKAWQALIEARKVIGQMGGKAPSEAWDHILRAEGSDWWWWYGDRNFTEQYDLFDTLFRNNLIQVYITLGLDVPSYLYHQINKYSQNIGESGQK